VNRALSETGPTTGFDIGPVESGGPPSTASAGESVPVNHYALVASAPP
jgi:hypothetical protein